MNKLFYLFLVSIILVSLCSCGDSDKKGLISAIDVYLNPVEDFYFFVQAYSDDYGNWDNYVDLLSKNPLQSLKLNGESIPISRMSYDGRIGYYIYGFLETGSEFFQTEHFDTSVDYMIEFSNKSISGSLLFPSQHLVSHSDFDEDSEWEIEWALTEVPDVQGVSSYFLASDDNEISTDKELDATVRDYRIPQSVWASLDDIWISEFSLSATNYAYVDKGFVSFTAYYDYSSYYNQSVMQDKTVYNDQARIARGLRLFERIKESKELSR